MGTVDARGAILRLELTLYRQHHQDSAPVGPHCPDLRGMSPFSSRPAASRRDHRAAARLKHRFRLFHLNPSSATNHRRALLSLTELGLSFSICKMGPGTSLLCPVETKLVIHAWSLRAVVNLLLSNFSPPTHGDLTCSGSVHPSSQPCQR